MYCVVFQVCLLTILIEMSFSLLLILLGTLTQGIRALAKRLEPGLTVAMQGAPEELQKIKVKQ